MKQWCRTDEKKEGVWLAAAFAFFICLFSIFLSVSTVSAFAEKKQFSIQQIQQKWPSFSNPVKLEIIEKLIKIAQFDVAQSLLERTNFSSSYVLAARFWQGALYKNTGRYKEAAKVYRSLLAENPKLHRVRLELGHTLFLMKEDQSAKHHFNLLMASGNAKSQQRLIQSFITAMDRRKKWNLNSYLTVAPSTNMNNGTDATIAPSLDGRVGTIGEDSRRKSGIGLSAGLSAGGRFSLSENLDIVTSIGGHIKKYKEDKFDDFNLQSSFGPRLRFSKGHVALYGTASRRWFAHTGDLAKIRTKNFGVTANLGYRLSNKDVLATNVVWQRRYYDKKTYQNSDFYQLYLRNDHYLNSHSFVRVMGSFSEERNADDRKDLEYKSWQAGLGFYKEFPLGLSLYTQGQFTQTNYNAPFATAMKNREVKRLDLMFQLTKRDWELWGYAPSLIYNYAKSESNSVFSEFDSHSVNFTLSKNF